MLTAPSLADPAVDPGRCAKGLAFAKAGDLPHAALYLEGCPGVVVVWVVVLVLLLLCVCDLSALAISSDPTGATVETDAMPGETLTTPAEIWVKAGTYKLRSNGRETQVTLAAHARGTVILTAPKQAAGPRAGHVDLTDGPSDSSVAGPPPAQKHPSLVPCKYDGCDTHSGEVLVDPLAQQAERVEVDPPRFRIGARAGIASSEKIAPAFALAAQWPLLALRAAGSQRERGGTTYTGLGLAVGVAHPVWS